MAHFRAEIRGARGVASRLGHKSTGITTLLQTWGWNVRVSADHFEKDGDVALIDLVHSSTGQVMRLAGVNLSTGSVHGYDEGGGSFFRQA